MNIQTDLINCFVERKGKKFQILGVYIVGGDNKPIFLLLNEDNEFISDYVTKYRFLLNPPDKSIQKEELKPKRELLKG